MPPSYAMLHEFLCHGIGDLFAEGEPGTQGEFGDLEAGVTKPTVAHRHGAKVGRYQQPFTSSTSVLLASNTFHTAA
jgi:hypothetical protein